MIWQIKIKSPIFHLANIFCTRLTQNLNHDPSVAVVQIEQSLIKYLVSMNCQGTLYKVLTNLLIKVLQVDILMYICL